MFKISVNVFEDVILNTQYSLLMNNASSLNKSNSTGISHIVEPIIFFIFIANIGIIPKILAH